MSHIFIPQDIIHCHIHFIFHTLWKNLNFYFCYSTFYHQFSMYLLITRQLYHQTSWLVHAHHYSVLWIICSPRLGWPVADESPVSRNTKDKDYTGALISKEITQSLSGRKSLAASTNDSDKVKEQSESLNPTGCASVCSGSILPPCIPSTMNRDVTQQYLYNHHHQHIYRWKIGQSSFIYLFIFIFP